MNKERHFYLYAKGWYTKNNLSEDINKIYDHFIGYEEHNIIGALFQLLRLVKRHNKIELTNFISDFKHNYEGDTILEKCSLNFNDALIETCLNKLRYVKAVDIPYNLGKPNFNLLSGIVRNKEVCFGV